MAGGPNRRLVASEPAAVALRPARPARLIEEGGRVSAYPQPHHTPVLPAGWAPLSESDQQAVLNACDEQRDALRLRLGSSWDHSAEYRVYELGTERWSGICAATVFARSQSDESVDNGANQQLLAIALTVHQAVRFAVDFCNWDLDAEGRGWRLAVVTDRGAAR